jgi:hypothetical protein
MVGIAVATPGTGRRTGTVINGLAVQLAAGLGAALILSATMLVSPSSVAAHVTRVVGPYTFLIVLIEEPYFQDNHAGFEFWVRDGDRAVDGLDRTLHAEAMGHGAAVVELSISPRNDRGFYDAPFYPGSGGPYSLHLTGSIERTAIDQLFLVTFPAYPRAPTRRAAVNRSAAQVQSDPAGGSMTAAFAGAIAGLVVLSGIAFVIVRRRRPLVT